jgi:hypothetical protein
MVSSPATEAAMNNQFSRRKHPMKRFSMALAPALMTGALIGAGIAAEAQTNILTVTGNTPHGALNDREDLRRGDFFSLTWTVTNTEADSLRRVNFGFRYDPAYVQVLGWDLNPDFEFPSAINTQRTVSFSDTGDYAGNNVIQAQLWAWDNVNGAPEPIYPDNNTLEVATLRLRCRTNAPGGLSDFGVGFTAEGEGLFGQNVPTAAASGTQVSSHLAPPDGNNFVTALNVEGGNFQNFGINGRDGGFRIGTVPAPSSLAIFALGGLVPVMGLVRRRRAAK